jgi:hypothetical protein
LYSSESDDSRRIHRPDKSDTVFATFSAPTVKKSKRTQDPDIVCVPLYVFVPDREPDFLTHSHVKLDILVDTQEPFNTSHHRVAFDYDEDTFSLVYVKTTLPLTRLSVNEPSKKLTG